ncbi:hypothetical protein KGQ64_06310 [bacterium]|nr:hypothetical protein [bacterium]
MSTSACHAGRSSRRALRVGGRRAAAWAIPIAFLSAACTRPLPDADGPGARVYAAQCGICHVAYQPGLMTPAMWEIQVARMDEHRSRRGLPPLADADRRVILEYLKAHAG